MPSLPPEITAPSELQAELAGRRLGSGRNRPLTVYARGTASGVPSIECVVKPRNRLPMAPLEYLCEWVGSAIATCLGLRTPRGFPVRVDQLFADSVMDPDLRADLRQSVGLCFGSEFVSDGFTQHTPELVLSTAQRRNAATVLAFDVFIHNPDRRADNPNLFTDRAGFLLFDHEAAFSFVLPLIGSQESPISSPALDIVDKHVFRHVFGRNGPDFDPFRSALGQLDDAVLQAIADGVPPEWTHGAATAKLPEIMDVLAARRDAVESWLPQVAAGVSS